MRKSSKSGTGRKEGVDEEEDVGDHRDHKDELGLSGEDDEKRRMSIEDAGENQ